MKTYLIIIAVLFFMFSLTAMSQEKTNRKPLIYKPEQRTVQHPGLQKKQAMPLRTEPADERNGNASLKIGTSANQAKEGKVEQPEKNNAVMKKMESGQQVKTGKSEKQNEPKTMMGKMPSEKKADSNELKLGSKTMGN